MKPVLLLGGMTYDATALYYTSINTHIRQRLGGRYSAELMVYSFNFHPLLEAMNDGEWDVVTSKFVDAVVGSVGGFVRQVEVGVVICANYPHKVAEEVEVRCNRELEMATRSGSGSGSGPERVKVLHIADFTARAILNDQNLLTAPSPPVVVGLLGTKVVMQDDFIRGRIEVASNNMVKVIVPDTQEERDAVDHELMASLPSGIVTENVRRVLVQAAQTLVSRGARGLVLGSTDLAFALRDADREIGVESFDTNSIHARGVAEWMLRDE